MSMDHHHQQQHHHHHQQLHHNSHGGQEPMIHFDDPSPQNDAFEDQANPDQTIIGLPDFGTASYQFSGNGCNQSHVTSQYERKPSHLNLNCSRDLVEHQFFITNNNPNLQQQHNPNQTPHLTGSQSPSPMAILAAGKPLPRRLPTHPHHHHHHHHHMTEADLKKLEKKRERNRIAATKCRQRKLEKILTLEKQVQELQKENEALRNNSNRLKKELESLKSNFRCHYEQGCQMLTSTIELTKEDNRHIEDHEEESKQQLGLSSSHHQLQQLIEPNPDSTCLS